jgi:xanthine dehydrogenase accessory factor
MTIRQLRESFRTWSAEGEPLVLASVYHTAGSTYSKAGARMLITGDGRFQGMLSGGCLEGDLAERARVVTETGTPQTVTYDLGKNDEELWGLGVGCDGLMQIFLQPLLPTENYQPFAAMDAILDGEETGLAATVVESADNTLKAGATLLLLADKLQWFGVPDTWREILSGHAKKALFERRSRMHSLAGDGRDIEVLFALLQPPPRVLLLGAGLDARPVLHFATELGWKVTVQDHRPAYLSSGGFAAAERVLCKPAHQLADELDLDRFDAVIVMSHHLATDRVYLEQLARTRVPYVGLLGPPDRRRRLLADLGASGKSLEGRLHGPAGLDIGADGPASIALSIVAEIHDELIGSSR